MYLSEGAPIGYVWWAMPTRLRAGGMPVESVGALIGLGFEGEAGLEAGAKAGAEAAADGISVFSDEEAWDVLEEIPNGSAAALLLIEHHWAVPLRDAVLRAGGFRISDGFISPLDLIGIGLISAEEAAEMHSLEQAPVST